MNLKNQTGYKTHPLHPPTDISHITHQNGFTHTQINTALLTVFNKVFYGFNPLQSRVSILWHEQNEVTSVAELLKQSRRPPRCLCYAPEIRTEQVTNLSPSMPLCLRSVFNFKILFAWKCVHAGL